MPPDDGVDVFHRLAADHAAAVAGPREVRLLDARVDRLERAQERNELWREALDRGDLGREPGVAANVGRRDEEERGQAGRLELVRDVRVPDGGREAVVALEVVRRVRIAVHEVQVGVVLGVPRGGVDVQAAEVAAELEVSFWAAVDELLLVPENDKATSSDLYITVHTRPSLGDNEKRVDVTVTSDTYLKRELISRITVKRSEVDSANFLAEMGRQLHDAGCIVQEGPGVWVRQRATARIGMVEWSQRRVVLVAWKLGKQMGISVRLFLVFGRLIVLYRIRGAEADRAREDLSNCLDSRRHGDAKTPLLGCARCWTLPLLCPHKYEAGLASFCGPCTQLQSLGRYRVSKTVSEFRKMTLRGDCDEEPLPGSGRVSAVGTGQTTRQ